MKDSYKKYQMSLSLGIFFGIIFIVWAICVATKQNFIYTFDNNIIKVICNNNPTNLKVARSLTALGNTSTIVIEAILLFIGLLIFKKYKLAGLEAGIMILGNTCNWIIKNIIKRSRPSVTHLVYADGYSFPSGHSLGSVTLFGSLFIITCVLVKSKPLKYFLNFLWIIFPLIIGYTRIYLHVHYPSDVFGGWIEGLTFVLIGYAIYLKISSNE